MTRRIDAGLVSFQEFFGSITRWAGLALIGGLAGFLAASLLGSNAQDASATARIGLTQQVQWPFFNATRQRVAARADSLAVADVVGSANVDGVKIDVTLPTNESFINVQATAPDAQQAADAANAYATELVRLDSESPQFSNRASEALAEVDTLITQLDADLKAIDASLVDLRIAQADAEARLTVARNRTTSAADLATATLERNEADAAVDTANADRDRVDRRLGSVEVQRDSLQLEVERDPNTPDVEMIRNAVPDELSGSSGTTRRLLGAVTGAAVVGLLGWVLDRSLSVIRTPAALRSATQLPVIDARWERGAGRLAIWIDRLPESHTVGFIGDPTWLETFLYHMSPFLLTPADITTAARAAREGPHVDPGQRLVALGQSSNGHWFDRGVGLCDEIVLVVMGGQARPADLQQQIRDVTALGGEVSLVVLLQLWASDQRSAKRSQTAQAA